MYTSHVYFRKVTAIQTCHFTFYDSSKELTGTAHWSFLPRMNSLSNCDPLLGTCVLTGEFQTQKGSYVSAV